MQEMTRSRLSAYQTTGTVEGELVERFRHDSMRHKVRHAVDTSAGPGSECDESRVAAAMTHATLAVGSPLTRIAPSNA